MLHEGDTLGQRVSWDPSILSLSSVSRIFPGDMGFGADGTIDNTLGTLTDLSVTSFTGTANTSFDIATLTFSADNLGLSSTSILISVIDVWTDQNGEAIAQPTAIGGSVNVVPIPGSILLLGSGILGLVGLSRRKRS